jgi:hypothetical protein
LSPEYPNIRFFNRHSLKLPILVLFDDIVVFPGKIFVQPLCLFVYGKSTDFVAIRWTSVETHPPKNVVAGVDETIILP